MLAHNDYCKTVQIGEADNTIEEMTLMEWP